MNTSLRTGVVIPSAGEGKRFGSDIPKQFLLLRNVPVLIHTVRHFENNAHITDIVVVTSEEEQQRTLELLQQYEITKVRDVVIGGKERQDSVFNGCKALLAHSPELILVHDAVRPCITHVFIEHLIAAGSLYGAVVPVLPVKETLGTIDSTGMMSNYPSRERTRIIQTPQAFHTQVLYNALASAIEQQYYGTDESSIVHRVGTSVFTIEGIAQNIKITTQEDFLQVEEFLKWNE
jgi:2-C-methyl-D-erythritol 4-phosphate cytidylyltransferase